jgi:hypothetical protein
METIELAPAHADQLRSSAITQDIIESRGYRSIAPGSIYDWRQLAGDIHSDDLLRKILHQGALAFPLWRVGEAERPYTWILRPDQPRTSKEGKAIKYEYPRNTANILDVLPRYRQALGDPEIPLWITEGAKKADALASAYGDSIVPVNENGVWGWRSKGRLIDDFNRILWEGRRVIVAPDGDVRHNKAVYQAVQRSARLFIAWGAAEVQILLLPCEKDGPKIGVDDFLGMGHTIAEVESHLVELAVVGEQSRVSLMKHPANGQPLFLPPGYDVYNHNIVRNDQAGPKHIYTGVLAITGTGRNLHTSEETATVVWDRFKHLQEATIPRLALTSGVRLSEAIGTLGAAIHGVNARELSRYLVEFIRENDDALPRVNLVDKLGTVGAEREGLVLPGGSIGLEGETRYIGPEVKVGTDRDAYQRALREVVSWPGDQVTLWATLAMGLAGPILSRLRPDRNPVVLLAKASGSGKTTVVHFSTGCYGDPLQKPLRVQCASKGTTTKGISQTLAITNGLPVHLEDVHLMMDREPSNFAGLIYDFANGQGRTFGTLNQQSGGGAQLGGTLLLTGEAKADFTYEGSTRRTLTIDCEKWWPLGAPAKSEEGGRRAEILTAATAAGAGVWGHQTCELVWANWESYRSEVLLLAGDPTLADLQAWRTPLAASTVALRLGMHALGIDIDWTKLLVQWAQLYVEGQKEHNPGRESFDRALVMLSQCDLVDNADEAGGRKIAGSATWEWLLYERKMVAARRVGDGYWRVLSTSPQWRTVVGANAVDMYGEEWLKAGLIRSHKGARPISERIHTGPGKGNLQCILIPGEHLSITED